MIREAYNQGVVLALQEKLGAMVDLSQLSTPGEGDDTGLRLLAGTSLGGSAALLSRAFLKGALRGRSPRSRAVWGGLGTLGALGLGGWVGQKALSTK